MYIPVLVARQSFSDYSDPEQAYNHATSSIGKIVGGVLGGIAAITILVVIITCCCVKREKKATGWVAPNRHLNPQDPAYKPQRAEAIQEKPHPHELYASPEQPELATGKEAYELPAPVVPQEMDNTRR